MPGALPKIHRSLTAFTPFGGVTPPESADTIARGDEDLGQLVLTRPGRVPAILAMALLALFTASSVRLVDEALRNSTRAPLSSSVTAARVERARRGANEVELRELGPGRSLKFLILAAVRAALPRPMRALLVRPGSAPGAYALGTNTPRAKRWIVLGGHGRFGPGASS